MTVSPRRAGWVFWAGGAAVAMVALSADQATKLYAEAFHLLAPPVPSMSHHRASSELVFGLGALPQGLAASAPASFLSAEITHVANGGVMLGALEEAARPIPLLAFMLTTLLALGIAAWLWRIANASEVWLRVGAVALAVGVGGNLIDRLRLGYVVDWLYLQWKLGAWAVDAPAFNLADLMIIGGATLAAVALFQRRRATNLARIRARGRPA